MKKWLPWLVLGLLAWWIVADPHGAAAAWRHIGLFFRDLTSGSSTTR